MLTEFFGEFSEASGKQCIDAMIEASLESKCPKVFLDVRKMTGNLTILARFRVAIHATKTRGIISKIALVARQKMILPDGFVENVAVNRGVNVKIHSDFDAGLRWLRE